jgi:peptidoglycan/LPS O-acetylase OafA/YrhL
LLGLIIGTTALYFLAEAGKSDFTLWSIGKSFLYNSVWIPFLHDFSIQNTGGNGLATGEIFPSNPPAWSLFFEMFASVMFVFLVRMSFKKILAVVVAALMAYTGIGYFGTFFSTPWTIDFGIGWGTTNFIGGFPRVLFGFSLGVMLYRITTHKRLMDKLCKINAKNSYILYSILFLILAFPQSIKGIYPLAILTVGAPSLILVAAKLTCKNKTEEQTAKFLGWISYPVYCLHVPIGRAAWHIGEKFHASNLMIMTGAMVSTLICAALLTKFIEEPARRFLSSKL